MLNAIRSSRFFRGSHRRTKPVRHFILKFLNDWSLDLSTMVAYNLLIALLPIAVALFGILGIILRNNPNAEERIKEQIINSTSFDNTTQQGIKQVLDLAFNQLHEDAGLILALGIIFAIFGGSRLFIVIDKCMTIIYRLPERTFFKQNILAIGMIFLFIFVIPLMIAISSAPTAFLSFIPGGGGKFGSYLASLIFSLFVSFIFFELIYHFIPNKKMTFKTTWCGALVAAVTLELFMILFPIYVRRFMTNYAGQIGFAVILLIFFFYFATILVLGAQINAFFFEHYGPLPDELGTYFSQMYHEHSHNDTTRPLLQDETDNSPELPTTTNNQHSHRNQWLNKLWPKRINPTNEQQENIA